MSLVANIPFTPCFMHVTNASPPYMGPPPPMQLGTLMGSAEYDHKNGQPVNIGIHIWSWFDSLVRVKSGVSGMPISSVTISGGLGAAAINQPPPKATTPFDTNVVIHQANLDSAYQNFGPSTVNSATLLLVSAWNKGTVLCSGWLAIFIKWFWKDPWTLTRHLANQVGFILQKVYLYTSRLWKTNIMTISGV